jgi:hypothetical protein
MASKIVYVPEGKIYEALVGYRFNSSIASYDDLATLLGNLGNIKLRYVPGAVSCDPSASLDKVEFADYYLDFNIWKQIVSDLHTSINSGTEKSLLAQLLIPVFYGRFYATYLDLTSASLGYWSSLFGANRVPPFNFGFLPKMTPMSFNGVSGIADNPTIGNGTNSYTIYGFPENMTGQTGYTKVYQVGVDGFYSAVGTDIWTINSSGIATHTFDLALTPANKYYGAVSFEIWPPEGSPDAIPAFYASNVWMGANLGANIVSFNGNIWSFIAQ